MKSKPSCEELVEALQAKTEQLARQEKFTVAALNAHSDTYFIFDPETKTAVYWNDSFRKVTGYSDKEIARKIAPDDWYSAEDMVKAQAYIASLDNPKAAPFVQLNLLVKKGDPIPFEYQASYFEFEKGKRYIVSIGRNISVRNQIEAERQQLQSRYKNLLSNLDDVVYRYEYIPERRFTFVTESATKILGYTPEEHYADPDLGAKMVHPEHRPLLEEYYAKSLTGNVPFTIKFLSKDGRTVWMEQRNTAIFNDDGEIIAVEGISRDVSEKVKLEEELRQVQLNYLDFINASSDPVSYWKIENDCGLSATIEQQLDSLFSAKCVEINKAACAQFGKEREQIIGKTFQELSGKDRTDPTILKFLENSCRLENLETEEMLPGGEIMYALETWYGIFDQEALRYIWITSKSITQLKETELELLTAKEKAEQSDRLKTEFINNMSHEIRTPMNGILGFTNFLEDDNLSAELRKQYVTIINNSGQQLMRIIDDILEISRLETKQVALYEDEFSLNDLLLELFSVFDLSAKTNKTPIYLKKALAEFEDMIIADRTKLSKILSNLIDNAIKYTNTGFVEIGYTVDGNELEIYVKDTGIGIHPEKQEMIFDRFSQEDKELSKQYGGLGLGLSIAKENSELLSGSIRLESVKGKGSTFYLRIPYRAGTSTDQQAGKSDIETATGQLPLYKVLIADDDEVNFLFLETALMKFPEWKFRVLHAKDGNEAVKICTDEQDLDLVLMDLKMPNLDGIDAAKIIHEMRPDLCIIAQTAYKSDIDHERAIMAGCNDYLAKPIESEDLKAVIRKHLR